MASTKEHPSIEDNNSMTSEQSGLTESDSDKGESVSAARPVKRRKQRNHWTEEEDVICREAVLIQLGYNPKASKRINWKQVERKMNNGRTAKQCRERWRLKL